MQLEPLRYLVEVAELVERGEPQLWAWFRSDTFEKRYKEKTADDLLRTAIRLERKGANERRYALADIARDRLGLAAPVTLYQMQDTGGVPNAFLVFQPGEIVVAFSGRILELLDSDAELLDLIGHEIAHHKLFVEADGRFHTTDRLLGWIVQAHGAPIEWIETWRRFRLHMEIYCDLGGLTAAGDRDATIRGLVKSLADFKDADAESYLRQARELLATGPGATRGVTHPELHVRVLAVADAGTSTKAELDQRVTDLIAGPLDLGSLDLLDQARLVALTRRVLDRVLAAEDGHSEAGLAHARQMFADYALPERGAASLAGAAPEPLTTSVGDYLGYLLLDLATVGDSGKATMAVAATAADELGIGTRFREIARQELRGRRALLSGLGRAA